MKGSLLDFLAILVAVFLGMFVSAMIYKARFAVEMTKLQEARLEALERCIQRN